MAVGLAVVLVALAVANGTPTFWEHYGCERGQLLASQFNWTPDLFWNAPFGGTVYAQAISNSGGMAGWDTKGGEVSLVFGQQQWNLTSVNRVLESGPGPSPHCPAYEVTSAPNLAPWQQSGGCGGCLLLGPGNVSDAGVPTQFNISIWGPGPGITSVIFHDAYVTDNNGVISTCGRGATEINLTTTHLDLQIPFVTQKGIVLIDSTQYAVGPASLAGFAENFTYFFPANFGNWAIDNLTMGPDAPGSGLAFSYSPCSV
jgi:hypothetical protein